MKASLTYRASRRTLPAALAAVATGMFAGTAVSVAGVPAASNPALPPQSPAGDGLLNGMLRQQSTAFNTWDIGGELRMRYESKDSAGPYPNNDFIAKGKVNSNDEFTERLRLHLGYAPTPWLKVYAEGRGSFAHNDVRSPTPDSDRADMQQAYLQLGDLRNFPLVATLGRQEWVYGDQHLIGPSDWSNTRRAFDAAKLRYENANFWLDAFAGRVVAPYDNHFNLSNDYDTLYGLYGSSKTLIPWQETQLYFLLRDASAKAPNSTAAGVPGSPTTARDIYTLGTRWCSLPGTLAGWDYSLEAALQFGRIVQSNVWRDQQASAVFASGGYTFTDIWGNPRLGAGYDFGSGDNNPNDGKNQTFDNLFGTNHRYYGSMDLFCERNMQIPRLCASIKPTKQLNLAVDYLMFWLASTHDSLYPESGSGRKGNGYGLHPGFSSYVGSEIDLVATYSFNPACELQLGCGHFFAGDYIRQSVDSIAANGGTSDANWFYVQTRFQF
ncbi:MAG: alginate export family protein [Verrucomicrobiota bacterium]